MIPVTDRTVHHRFSRVETDPSLVGGREMFMILASVSAAETHPALHGSVVGAIFRPVGPQVEAGAQQVHPGLCG